MGIRKPRNSIQHVWIAKVSLCYSFLSIHIIWEPTRYGLEEKTEILILSLYFMSNWNGKVLRFYSDTRASLPLLARALNSHFKVFLRSGRRKTGNCSFTAAPIGGKLDFPVFLSSKGRKSGNCSFTASFNGGNWTFQFSSALRGGKLEFAALPPLPSAEKSIFRFSSALSGGKLEIADMLRIHMADVFRSDFFSFFPFFCFLVGHGSGLCSTKWRTDMCE